jgi:hypothetical protein
VVHDEPQTNANRRVSCRMNITQSLPTSESVLQLEPEELGHLLLQHLASNENNLHLSNLLGSDSTLMRHYHKDERVEQAYMEAWAWLVREDC